MGKPFAKEISNLGATYKWAMQEDIDRLVEAVEGIRNFPLIATGSGGSLTAAWVASQLHETYAETISKPVTPFELINTNINHKSLAIIFISAGGRNVDIINAFKLIVAREPQKIIILGSDNNSPLSKLARDYSFVDSINFELPFGKDGFLATNSLLAFSVLMVRAWAEVFKEKTTLPLDLPSLVHPNLSESSHFESLREMSSRLWEKETISVLCGFPTRPAAVDFESKFTEAALGSVQIADYRNFAHGRHHWLAKHESTTGIAAFVTEQDKEVATKTLALIPKSVPILRIDLPFSDERAMISSLIQVMELTALAGENRGIDPGRPGVPDFGRKIYHLRANSKIEDNLSDLSLFEKLVIGRKSELNFANTENNSELHFWKSSLQDFIQALQKTKFQGIVFDYDGTLCDRSERFTGVGEEITKHLIKFLKTGVKIGIATGRGKSVRADLRKKIPNELWDEVIIGYYNGAEILLLSDDDTIGNSAKIESNLADLNQIFEENLILSRFFSWETRARQLTLQPNNSISTFSVLQMVQELIDKHKLNGLTVLYSSHSIDVLAPNVSKINVVRQLKEKIGKSANVVCIGDRGRYPGNDYTLLAEDFSLSVDEVSLYPETCWNLAPAGWRGVRGTLHYLNSINFGKESFRFDIKRLTKTK